MTTYEAEHFGYDEGGRRVADTTLRLMSSFYPAFLARPMDVFSRCLMDEPLLAAFRLRRRTRRWCGPPRARCGPGPGSRR